ncbi:hypothetical protein CGI93_22950 [Vibrio parahaemolyticus]|nr:hypothetical protein [Vibrio parahaemolyticus]MDF4462201.1 hypothetical protein [Vibrio parahaemolyticus]MDF4466935.1 hypothetical protein [Vibrio parahaemolyticus]MDF4471662.1 hypothetical protein [Vibrio parahaemolyticus]MDF4494943.1 hypothetical protein [Vibrio parahaemolyticus]MDF4711327.1 hypothetical protein [Vibrio parahaemolyticus]
MSEILDFSPVSRAKSQQQNILESFDKAFFSLTSAEEKILKKLIKQHFKKVGVNLLYTSKKVNFGWVKNFKPLLHLESKVAFSYNIEQEITNKNGWKIYPLEPKQPSEILHNINYIANIIRLQEKNNE